jgi:glycosyltransferase involved in cell wall biosynthesis
MKLESHIHFHGHVDHQVLAGLLAGSDIFVTPALSDGNNVSLNEAMACGCFPIASNIPANSQWITDGVNGYLYPAGDVTRLADAIEMAIDKTELRLSARTANRAIVETKVDWRICVKRMDDIYQQATGGKGSGL